MDRLKGKVALVTGAGGGIGRAIAILFAKEGAMVAIAELNEAAGAETAAMIEKAGGRAIAIVTDVTQPESVEAAVRTTVESLGPLTVMVNNAGGSTHDDAIVTEMTIDAFWHTINLDLYGTVLGCRIAIPALIKSGGGAIVNISSIASLKGLAGKKDAYTAAKGGVNSLTRSIANTFGKDGVRANAICPGATLTERVRQRSDAQSIVSAQAGGFVQPEDIAFAALYLASDEARMTTGVIMPVDGGIMAS